MSRTAIGTPGPIDWSPWYPLNGSSRNRQIPAVSGLYRARIAETGEVVYIGQIGNSLRGRLSMLSTCYRAEMPYRDPHTAAPTLWSMRHRDGVDFEVSVAPLGAETKVERMALEAVAITVHRAQHGRSPQANFGGAIAGYRLSSANNAGLVAAGKRFTGGPDPTVSASVSVPVPGPVEGEVHSGSWLGLDWSPWMTLDDLPAPATTGIYRLRRSGAVELLYVGQGRITSRVRAHWAKAERAGHRQAERFAGEVEVSWVALDLESRGLLEIENDAIASHRLMRGSAPVAQFIG